MWQKNGTEVGAQGDVAPIFGRSVSCGLAIAWLFFALALPGCGASDNSASADDSVGFDLTIQSPTLLWGSPNNYQPAPAAGQTLSACFLDPAGDGLDSQKQLFRDVVSRTWEFAANIHVNWVDPCPATGSLIRIGIQGRATAAPGWSAGVGTGIVKGPKADNFATQACLTDGSGSCPSIKVWAANAPVQSDFDEVAYTAAHEFGHALGFQHEQDSPNNYDSNGNVIDCTRNLGSVKTAVTSYDHESVMNYCNSHGNLTGFISGLDVAGSQQLYGPSRRYQAATWLVASL